MKTTGGRRVNLTRVKSTAELLQPEILPEAGFQSYEKLKNNGLSLKNSFISGQANNPDLHHPHLEETTNLEDGIDNLEDAITTIKSLEYDANKADIVSTSLKFRASEMEYVKQLADLDDAIETGESESSVSDLLESTRTLGRKLYGDIDEDILVGAKNTIWQSIDSKQLHPSAASLYQDISKGFTWKDKLIPGLDRPSDTHTLPSFDDPSLPWLRDTVTKRRTGEADIIDKFWQERVNHYGEDYKAGAEDIADAFKEVLKFFDNGEESSISVVIDPESSNLSWETPQLAVKVGQKRNPISSKNELMRKVVHELIIHGGRAINGLKSDLPILGTGLYTNTERPDYLTFEEGLATTVEEALGDTPLEWSASMLTHYVNVSLVNQGADFRSAFETSWRWRLLMNLKDNEEVTSDKIIQEKSKAYDASLRVFRGTPTILQDKYPGSQALTYNKDLSYLNGRVVAMNYIKDLHQKDDTRELLGLIKAKYDPTVPEQAEIVRQYSIA